MGGGCGVDFFGSSSNEADASKGGYVCFTIDEYPSMKPFDINGDGIFGEDDVTALYYQEKDDSLSKEKRLEIDCTAAKFASLTREAQLKLRELTAQESTPLAGTFLLRRIGDLESEMLAKHKTLSDANPIFKTLIAETRGVIYEMALRARQVVSGNATDEPFGPGFYSGQNPQSKEWWPLRVAEVLPFGAAAAAGILPGDYILAVDGVPVQSLSTDGSINGIVDQTTQCARGFCGSRNSEVAFTIRRGEVTFSKTLRRNVWIGRHLGVPVPSVDWDGKVHYK